MPRRKRHSTITSADLLISFTFPYGIHFIINNKFKYTANFIDIISSTRVSINISIAKENFVQNTNIISTHIHNY